MSASQIEIPSLSSGKQPVELLLGLWGERYINSFLALGLRSLLAPGNIPALAQEYDCTFTFLTTPEDEEVFRANPAFAMLTKYCRVEFVDITDLIFDGNYSTTLTLAYDRGMKRRVDRMCQTYFIYLVSDYIMADGSFAGMMKYMKQGYSGITAGNFQIVEDETLDDLHAMINPVSGVLAIPPRELLRYSYDHLHPVTLSNHVDQSLFHNLCCNRLFWRAGPGTIVGRFYLRHMLCIRPETDNYEIGASCDYSFISEMCPSGKVAHLSDSDEYLVVELQPRQHETNFIRFGTLSAADLAAHLSEWTTADHRRNAHHAVVYHSGDIPESAQEIIHRGEEFVCMLEQKMSPVPQPHRGHPYWIGAMQAAQPYLAAVSESDSGRLQVSYNENDAEGRWIGRLRRTYHRMFGKPPEVYPWHPLWPDYKMLVQAVRRQLAQTTGPMLVVVDAPTLLVNWLVDRFPERVEFRQLAELCKKRRYKSSNPRSHDSVLVLMTHSGSIARLHQLLATLAPQMKAEQRVILWMYNNYSILDRGIQQHLNPLLNHLESATFRIETVYAISGRFTGFLKLLSGYVFKTLRGMSPGLYTLFAIILLPPLTIALIINNLILRLSAAQGKESACTSSMMIFLRRRAAQTQSDMRQREAA